MKMWLGLNEQSFISVLRRTDFELVLVCSSAPASCWWAHSACWETKASWSLILDSSLWRGRIPINTHTDTHTRIHADMSTHTFLIVTPLFPLKILSLCLTAHSNFIHHDPAGWHLTYVHAELLDGCLDAVDLLCEPAVQSPLRHCLSVQSLQAAGDSLEQGLVALSGHTNTRAAGKKASWGHYWKRFSENTKFLPNYLSKYVSALTWGNRKVIQLRNCASFYMSSYFTSIFP